MTPQPGRSCNRRLAERKNLLFQRLPAETFAMTVSRLPKSESRLLVEREWERKRHLEVEVWRMTDTTFFAAFVAVCAALAVIALALRA